MNLSEEMSSLVNDYRARCLWFLRPDFRPQSQQEILYTLDLIERYGDRNGYLRAERIRQWLSHPSKVLS